MKLHSLQSKARLDMQKLKDHNGNKITESMPRSKHYDLVTILPDETVNRHPGGYCHFFRKTFHVLFRFGLGFSYCFKTGFYVAQGSLRLTMFSEMTLNFRCSCLHLPSTGLHHYARFVYVKLDIEPRAS